MTKYARVDDIHATEFTIGETHPDDPGAPDGQMLHPVQDEPQTVSAEDLYAMVDAVDDEDLLKVGWYDLDAGAFIGPNRPDNTWHPNEQPSEPEPEAVG